MPIIRSQVQYGMVAFHENRSQVETQDCGSFSHNTANIKSLEDLGWREGGRWLFPTDQIFLDIICVFFFFGNPGKILC